MPDDLRVLIVADDPLVRSGLAILLGDQENCTVVGQIAGDDLLHTGANVYRPDVLLWDLGWDFMGIDTPRDAIDDADEAEPKLITEFFADLQETGIPVVVLLPDESNATELWAAGARGFLPRNADVPSLFAALEAALQGLVTLDPLFAASLIQTQGTEPPPLIEDLTPREQEVLQLLAEGLPNKSIARRLDISDHTVKFHVNAIMTKLNAQSRTEAVVRATRLGLILL